MARKEAAGMDTLIRGGTIVTDGLEITADLGISKGRVSHWGGQLEASDRTEIIEAEGRYVFPGAIECCAAMNALAPESSPELAQMETGLAALGGVTTLIFPIYPQSGAPLGGWVASQRHAFTPHSFVDFGFHLGLTAWSDEVRRWIREAGQCGLASIFLEVAPPRDAMDCLEKTLWKIAEETGPRQLVLLPLWDALIASACLGDNGNANAGNSAGGAGGAGLGAGRDAGFIPAWMEGEVVERLAAIGNSCASRFLLRSVASRSAVEALKRSRESGMQLLAAASMYHLLFSSDTLPEQSNAMQPACWPPRRGKSDQSMLWFGLDEGICPIVTANPGFSAARGMLPPATEAGDFSSFLALLWPLLHTEGVAKNRLSLGALVQAVTSEPAKLVGLYPQKGSLLIGSDADVVVFNPQVSWRVGGDAPAEQEEELDLDGPAPQGPFAGRLLQGAVEHVFLRGNKIVAFGQMTTDPGNGRFLERRFQLR
jgi:dihydropyrimidinase